MNIFAYHSCPVQSAMWLDDVRKNKMILEGCQLLSTTVALLVPAMASLVYKTTHKNHPCAVWARSSHSNFCWLLDHTIAMHEQRKLPHKSARLFPIFKTFRDGSSGIFPEKNLTPFANCARNAELGLDFTVIEDTHIAYRLYSAERWKRDTIKLSWKHGEKPNWCPI